MSKRAVATCEDCYFRREGLCALPGRHAVPDVPRRHRQRSHLRCSRASCSGRRLPQVAHAAGA